MAIKIGMVSLGCPKNQVDAEMMLADLKNAGYEITPTEAEAEVIIVNTCGFLESAVSEAIENIIEVAQYKADGTLKALIVTGCMAERYRDQISENLPEVDVVVGIGKNSDIAEIINSALKGEKKNYFGAKEDMPLEGERVISTAPYTAYLKIADGCDNCCTYCAIPMIRGKFRSRSIESVVAEAQKLAENGIKELVLVAQDTTRYGEDLYGKAQLATLLRKLDEIEGIEWIRILYTYPERIDSELIAAIKECKSVAKYLDIPIQHCNGRILREMNRSGDKDSLAKLMKQLRDEIPEITIRTTIITGFPGETEEDFQELCEFLSEQKFDRLGCFPYSQEPDTPAADFPNQVDPQLRQDRAEIIMNDQLGVVRDKNEAKAGSIEKVIIEGYDDYIRCYFGRSQADAPEIDGKVFFFSPRPLEIGTFVDVLINDTVEYDLLGELWEEEE